VLTWLLNQRRFFQSYKKGPIRYIIIIPRVTKLLLEYSYIPTSNNIIINFCFQMATIAEGTPAPLITKTSIERISELPVVESIVELASNIYSTVKDSNNVVRCVLSRAENTGESYMCHTPIRQAIVISNPQMFVITTETRRRYSGQPVVPETLIVFT